jgi:ADP-heptose:LPS heptosyltransferase
MQILFISATRIGDCVLSSGLLSHLIEQHPGAAFTVAAGPAAAPLFESMPGLERIIVLRKRGAMGHWVHLWSQCVATRWDLVIDLRRSAIAWMLRAGQRRILAKPEKPMHRVELLASTIGLSHAPPAPVCWTSPRDDATAAALIPDGGPVLAIAAAANWPGKQWRAANFADLVARLTGPDGILPGARVAVLAAAAERDQIEPLFAAIPAERLLDLVGRTGLPVAAAALRRCDLFVGNDSGLMHMAAAVGTPTLGLFGPSHTTHYAPWGPRAAWVRTAKPYAELVGGPGYDHRNTGTLMDSLSVDSVTRAARVLWQRVANTGGPA